MEAPVKKGETVGKIIYSYGEKELGTVDILANEDVAKAGYRDYLKKILGQYFVITE